MDQEITFDMNLDGERVTCTVLFTFSSEETGANYMLYTPDDPAGTEVRLMAARFDPLPPSTHISMSTGCRSSG